MDYIEKIKSGTTTAFIDSTNKSNSSDTSGVRKKRDSGTNPDNGLQ